LDASDSDILCPIEATCLTCGLLFQLNRTIKSQFSLLVKDKTDVTMTFFIISACFSTIPLLYWAVWAIAIVLDLQLPVQSVHITAYRRCNKYKLQSFLWSDRGPTLRSTTLEASMPTITPRMLFTHDENGDDDVNFVFHQ
jgi:hypothetical protein